MHIVDVISCFLVQTIIPLSIARTVFLQYKDILILNNTRPFEMIGCDIGEHFYQ